MTQKSIEKREIRCVVAEGMWCCRGEIILLERCDQSSTSWVEERREIEEAEVINAVCTVSKFRVEENEREWTGFWAGSVIWGIMGEYEN